ncbi:MAG: M23 family metallopeptidase [Rhodobacteraceae bacterium]|nr:M23 family metallopeptidase [Paracoccaceae bacterium]
MRAALAAFACLLAAPAAAGEPVLGLPIGCDAGMRCHIQQHVDRDPGPGARDYRCGDLSYDGHKGTDFAVPTGADMARGVPVLAAAPGRVAATRDGMPDTGLSEETAATIAGRECGNGVLIRHGEGWETQYCHLRSGSVRVKQGDAVGRGTPLGLVGQSGRAQFPHVHLSVRHDGAVVDPFDAANASACGSAPHSLWLDPPPYRPGGLIAAGFAERIPHYDAIRAGTAGRQTLPADTPALVVFALAFGGRQGDILNLAIDGPGGRMLVRDMALDRDQARFFRAAGKRRTGPPLAPGEYTASIELRRDGAVLDRIGARVTVN